MSWCNACSRGKRGGDLKNKVAPFALTSWHLNLQINGMKTNGQGLHPTRSFAFPNDIPTPALRANKQFVHRLDAYKHPAVSDLCSSGLVALRDAKNLMQ